MFRKIPVANKLVSNRIKEKNSEIHEQKLRTITSQIDSNVSGSYNLCIASHNKNRSYFQESKNTQIERENRLLLEKITKIKKQNTPNSSAIYKTIQTEEAQESTANTTDTIQSSYQPKIRACSSGRKKILLGIMDENRKMLERIKASKSELNHQKLEKEYKQKEELMLQISEFPLALPRRLPSRNQNNNNNYNNMNNSQYNSITLTNNSSFIQNSRNTIDQGSISPVSHNKKHQSLEPKQIGNIKRVDNDQQNYQSEQKSFIRSYVGRKTMLFDGTICHGDKTYMLKIFVEGGVFKIIADQESSQLTQVLEMAESDGMKVIKQVYSNSVLALVQNITITDKIRLHALDARISQQTGRSDSDNNSNNNNNNSSFLPQIEQAGS